MFLPSENRNAAVHSEKIFLFLPPMGQSLTAVKHNLCWETSQGFQLSDDFSLAVEGEVHTTIVMLSEREGHNQFNRLIEKFLTAFGIPLEKVHERPISVWVTREAPDPTVTGQYKTERRLLNNPTPAELNYFLNDSRWTFYFKILAANANNGSSVVYHIYRQSHPLDY
jgi:hypothetical protein